MDVDIQDTSNWGGGAIRYKPAVSFVTEVKGKLSAMHVSIKAISYTPATIEDCIILLY